MPLRLSSACRAAACAALLLAACATPRPSARDDTCTVTRITDGDTFRCRDAAGTTHRVRLLLVDAPEREQRPYGARATRALQQLTPVGTAVRLERDVQETDRYGRLLAYVHLADGRMVNEELARGGYVEVLVYPPNVRHVERIRAARAEAQRARRGLWATEAFSCPPREFRAKRC